MQNPASEPLTMEEMDQVYDLPLSLIHILLSNLVAIYQNNELGKLSAYCGAV